MILFDSSRVDAITAVAKDADGTVVARAAAGALPEPGTLTETGPGAGETGPAPDIAPAPTTASG
jgi:hypothetical protein